MIEMIGINIIMWDHKYTVNMVGVVCCKVHIIHVQHHNRKIVEETQNTNKFFLMSTFKRLKPNKNEST